MTESAVAVREDRHPLVAQIDAKMPEIAGMLPDGMRPERFRKVVVQALLRTPGLWECTPISVVTAITEAAEVGIEPTGVLGKGWLIPYRGEAKFIPGWRGFVDLCWRADRLLLTPELVREGDHFEYRRGTGQYLHHVPALDDPERERDDDNVTFAYVIVRFPDGREDFEVMSRAALDRIRDESLKKIRDLQKREQAIWNVHPGEMMKKTPIRRIAKRLPLSPAVQAMLARDEEVDFDTPVERLADPKRDELRDRISQRTAALRGESSGESEAGGPEGGAEPAAASSETSSAGGSPARKGDPWMARLHAMGAERGLEHEALSEWAQRLFKVGSLTELDPKQRGQFMARVEAMPAIGQECAHPPAEHAATDDGIRCGACDRIIARRANEQPDGSAHPSGDGAEASEGASAPVDTPAQQDKAAVPATTQSEAASPPGGSSPASAPTLEDVLAVTGGELVPPKPGTDEYKALPTGTERAAARSYWEAHKVPEPTQESLAEALGAPEGDR